MKLAIFDFDGTLFTKETLPFLLKQWKAQGMSRSKLYKAYLSVAHLYLFHKTGFTAFMSMEQIRVAAFHKFSRNFKHMHRADIDQFLHQSAENAIPYMSPKVVSEVEKAQQSGYHTVILSGCYRPMLDYVATSLGMDTVLGSEFTYTDTGQIDWNHPVIVANGPQKVHRIRDHFQSMNVDWNASRAYADSYHDIHILNEVGHRIAVNPDNTLRQHALAENWTILDE